MAVSQLLGHSSTCVTPSCDYGPGTIADCEAHCRVGETEHLVVTECSGPPGEVMTCYCSVNGKTLNDDFDFGSFVYASDCADAGRRAANGACIDRLNCCFEYPDGDLTRCLCGSDPSGFGHETCEALATSVGGEVVDICPKYLPEDSGGEWCFPPPCNSG